MSDEIKDKNELEGQIRMIWRILMLRRNIPTISR